MKGKPHFLVPIEQYFDAFYKTLQRGVNIDTSRLFLLSYNTVIPQRLINNRKKLFRAFNLSLKEYHISLEVAEVNSKRNHASLVLIENGCYSYANMPDDIITEVSDIEYYIEIKRINGQWKISYMDSNNDAYLMANEKSSLYFQEMENRKDANIDLRSVCLNKAFDSLDEEIDRIKLFNLNQNEMRQNEKENIITAGTYGYDYNNGIIYARKYARYNEVPEKERLFYYVSDNDCTNFMSQCVWAAYGGYVNSNIEASKKNVAEKNRMVYTGSLNSSWYGTAPGGGGTPPWENVINFFNYVTAPKDIGPRGRVYGEGKQKDFNFFHVKPGHILQFWPASKNKWYHSCYVSSVKYQDGLPYIYVCQHTRDIKDRPLIEILNWNTNEGKIRGISFDSANFNN
ncbi:MAG: hypothetical protein GX285_05580 [Clostridiales bacterium]|nr:hypothetical protein [Clostridiales bacterium]